MKIYLFDMSKYIDAPVKCLSPRVIHNKYTGKELFVSCGHCPACELNKSYLLTSRVEAECHQHPFSIFFTLTYDNDHVPYFEVFSDELGDYLYSEDCYTDQKRKPVVYSENSTLGFLPFLQNDKSGKLRVGHLSKYDIQCFMKRLRINISRHYENKEIYPESEKIRYFISGEYGPNTYRPHYHGILWTDCKLLAADLPDLICKSWTFASEIQTREQISQVTSSAAQYVSSYVNGVCRLPKYLQLPQTRPFYVASKNPFVGFEREKEVEIYENALNGRYTISKFDEQTKQFIDVEIPTHLGSKLFPKCRNFDKLNTFQRVAIYSKDFELARRKAKKDCIEYVCSDISRPSKRFATCSLDTVKKYLRPFQRLFNYKLKCKDLMLKSKSITEAAYKFMFKYFPRSLADFVKVVDDFYKHKRQYALARQFELYNNFIYEKRFSDVRTLYLSNFDKHSDCYLGANGLLVDMPEYVRKCVSWLKCSFDFTKCNLRPYGHKLFDYLLSPIGSSYQLQVESNFQNRTKFKRVNDSPLTKFKSLYPLT